MLIYDPDSRFYDSGAGVTPSGHISPEIENFVRNGHETTFIRLLKLSWVCKTPIFVFLSFISLPLLLQFCILTDLSLNFNHPNCKN